MALTFRSIKGTSLTINELDNNFRHFTGSHEISGSITLTEGGVSNTLSATDIANLQAGKSIVPTAGARGTITNYAQYDALYNVNDSTTFVDLRTDGIIDFKAGDESVFTIIKPTSGLKDGTITLGRDCFYKTQIRCDLIVSGNLLFPREGVHILGGENVSGSFGATRVKSLKVGSDSVVIEGERTSYMKAAVITSVDGVNGGPVGAAGIYTGGSAFGANRIILGAGTEEIYGDYATDPGAFMDLPQGSMQNTLGSETITGLNVNRIRFDVNATTYLDLINNNVEAYKPIKLIGDGIPNADTDPTLQVLVLKDGVITPGAFVNTLGSSDPGSGAPNQNAFSTASVDGTNILADSAVGTLGFAFASGLSSSIDGQTVTISTGSGFTVPLTLQDVTNNGNTTTTLVTVGQLSVSTNAQIATTLEVGGSTTIAGAGTNLFVNDTSNQGGIFLGVTNADGNNGASFIHDASANLKIENYNNNINLVAGGNIGIGTSNPDTKITLGENGDDVKLFADVDNAAANVLMLTADNIVKKSTFAELLGATTIDASQISNLNYFTTADLPAGTVSGSSQIDFDLLTNLPTGLISGSIQLNAGSNQGDLNLVANGTTGFTDSVSVPGLSTSGEPTFAKLNLTSVDTDQSNERTPLVIVGNEIKLANLDYVTQTDLDTVIAASGSFVLAVSGSNEGLDDSGSFTINSVSQPINFKTTGEGIEIDSTTETRTLAFSLSDGVVSGSSQIASEISGAFNAASASIASDIEGNITNITTNTTNITTLTAATSSYYTDDSDVDGANITNNDIIIGAATGTLGDSVTVGAVLNGSGVVSGSEQIDFGSITGTGNVFNGQLELGAGAQQGQIKLNYQVQGAGASVVLGGSPDGITALGLGTLGTPEFAGLKLSGLNGNSTSVTPLVIDGSGNIYTGSEYTTADDVDPYDLDITTSGDNGSITITNSETLIISGAGGLDVSSDTNTLTLTIGGGILSSSAQINTDISGAINAATSSLLNNITFISESAQVDFNSITGVPTGLVSGTIAFRNGDSDTATLLPTETASFIQTTQGTVFDIEVTDTSGGVQVNFYTPDGIVSGSSQVTLSSTTGYSTFSSSFASNIASNTSDISTNTGNITTNTTNISNNASSISSLNAATSSYLTTLDGALSSSAFSATAQGTLSASINGVATIVDLGLETGDSPTFAGLTLTGENPITLSPGGLTNNASTVPLVYEAGTGKIYIGDAYSTYTSESDFSSFVASGSTGGATIGGADTLTIGGNNGITTVGTQNGQNGQITVELDSTFDILSHYSLAAPISGAFNAASASIDSSITSLSSSVASDIATNDTAISTNATNITTLTNASSSFASDISTNSTDISALEASASTGVRIESETAGVIGAGFSLESFQTASFGTIGNGLNVTVNGSDNTVKYYLTDGVLSGSSQIQSQISGAFGSDVADLQDQIDTNSDNVQTNAASIIAINNSTSSLENQNAFATASIIGGGSILADGLSAQLNFEAGNGIYLEVDNNKIVITSSGGGTADGYIGDVQDHMAGGNLDMDGNNITNASNITVENNIVLTAGGSDGKIAFGNDTTNTFIYANATNTNTEDLEIHSHNDILLRPDDNVGIKTTTPQHELDVAGTIRAKQVLGEEGDVIAERNIIAGNGVIHLDNTTDGIFFNTDEIDTQINGESRLKITDGAIRFNDDEVALPGNIKFKTSNTVNALFIDGNGTYNGNVGINTDSATHQLTVNGSFKVQSDDGFTNTVIIDDLPTANSTVTEVVMIHPTSGQLYTTASSAVIGGGGSGTITVDGEVISSNTIALYDNTNETAIFPAMTDPEEGSTTPLRENYGYLRAEFYGRVGNTIQAARTVFVWNSGSGDNLIATTVEDIRTDGAHTLFDINSVTGTWNGNGDLVMSLQQYNQGTGVEVDYKLRYITI